MDELFIEAERDRQDYSYEEYQEWCYLKEREENKKESPLKSLFDGMAAAYKQQKPNNN